MPIRILILDPGLKGRLPDSALGKLVKFLAE